MLMKHILIFIAIFILKSLTGTAQPEPRNPYHLVMIETIDEYRDECIKAQHNKLIDLKVKIPSIQLDIRYATNNNFTRKKVYTSSKAFLREPAAMALSKVQEELKTRGLGLKVYDAYRPYEATILFYNLIRDTMFVASPEKGSRHNRGCAVDVSLIDLQTGTELEMPTMFDDFSERANPQYNDLPDRIIRNRSILLEAMRNHGFEVYNSEWWHIDFQGWQNFTLMDLTFEELESQ
jgi:D-alanyl-D-alanine dipeptidase